MVKRERNAAIIALHNKGKSPSDIALLFNVSRGRIHQIVVAYESREKRRAELKERYGTRPKIDQLPDDTPIDVLILCKPKIPSWEVRVSQLPYASTPIKTLGDLRRTSGPKILRVPHIGPMMLTELRALCPFRRGAKKHRHQA
jgi:hypothetical protein